MITPVYVPIFRLRQQEKGVLNTFDFGEDIFPYVEIFKAQPQKAPESRAGARTSPKPLKPFHQIYLPILEAIKSERIFVDLPVHLVRSRNMPEPVIEFLLSVVEKRAVRTERILSLSSCKKIIPVISTYAHIGDGEKQSILLQEADLRSEFDSIAYRTSGNSIISDIAQIRTVAKPQDFLFIDLGELCLSDPDDIDEALYITGKLKDFDGCSVVIINSPIPHTLSNSKLEHAQRVSGISNTLMDSFEGFNAQCFADYAGVKKDLVEEGGGISPGLLFYDAIGNDFYGYRGRTWKKDEKRHLDDIKHKILKDLLISDIVTHMNGSHLEYLGSGNKGWKMVNDMWDENEAWRSQAKLKRISMEHYLYCIRTKLNAGYFNR